MLTSLLKDDLLRCQASFLKFGGAQKVAVLVKEPVYIARVTAASLLIELLADENPRCTSPFHDFKVVSSLNSILEGSVKLADSFVSGSDVVNMREAAANAISALTEATEKNLVGLDVV